MAAKLNVMFVLAAVLAAALHSTAAQKTHIVGDSLGWTFPPAGAVAYSTWASAQTFAVGDILVFNFTTGSHNVAAVNKNSFDSCGTTNPISVNNNGPASIPLAAAGEHFYICAFSGHCTAGMKLAINVSGTPSTSPAPSPQPPATPAPAPAPKTSSPTPAPATSPAPAPKTSSPTPAPATSPAPSTSRTPKTYVVGDALGWTVPPGGPIAYQTWAANKTFFVDDILVFNFTTNAHDVISVASKAAYDSCNYTGTPILTGPARITLTTPGQHFYICTFNRHCSLGQKLAINVTGTASPAPGPSSPGTTPSPSGSATPTPSTPATPSPAGGVSAPPPPNSAPAFAGAALPVTFLAVALAFFY